MPLFGAMRAGAVAVTYHLIYIAVFVGMGIALLRPKPWGYRMVLGGTLFYSLDKVLYLFDEGGRDAELTKATGGVGQVYQLVDPSSIHRLVNIVTVCLLACWLGFALYVFLRRRVFEVGHPK